jgi:peptidoglycan/LPS O-acetylase OafA/YrhL
LTLTESRRANVVSFGSPTDYLLGQAWTLCYEEQFYLVAGIALIVRPKRFFSLALVVTVVTLAVSSLAASMALPVGGFFFDGHWLMFAAGILVYWQVNYGSPKTLVAALACLATGLVYAVLIVTRAFQLNEYLFAGFAFAGLILALHPRDRTIAGEARLNALRFAETICFSLYLSHAVIVRSLCIALRDAGFTSPTATLLVVVPACVVVAVIVAWLLHVAVEQRFLSPTTVPATPEPETRDVRARPEPRMCSR